MIRKVPWSSRRLENWGLALLHTDKRELRWRTDRRLEVILNNPTERGNT